jgi:hypothetical protein
VPRPLRALLGGHEIFTAQEMNRGRLKNGEPLLRAKASGFQVFVTSDQNLRYRQNFEGRRIALLILSTNYWPALRNCRDAIKSAIQELQPGQNVVFEV